MRISSLLMIFCCTISASRSLAAPVVEEPKEGENWQLIVRSPGTPAIDFAAAELSKYLHAMTGVGLVRNNANVCENKIVIGLREDLSQQERDLLPPPAKGYDGYAIAMGPRSDPRIVIAGDNGRGAVYGVYDLLEQMGCRWFYPTQDSKDPEVVPATKDRRIFLHAKQWAIASPMKYRICNGDSWFFDMNLDAAKAQLDWAMKNRYNAMGWQSESKTTLSAQYEWMKAAGLLDELEKRGMMLHGPAHSFDHFLRDSEYMTEHPEWFGMRDGKRVPQSFIGAQFCWSNADARHQFAENVAAFAKSAPRLSILCIVPFDGGRACDCPECRKSTASDLLMLLMGEVIERVHKDRPELPVETVGGYGAASDPPLVAKIHPEQRVVWAHWGRYYGIGYDDPKYDRRDNLAKWHAAARGGITVCQYYTDNFAEPWVMPPFTTALVGDRKYFLQEKIDSVYMLMWPPGYWWNHSLNGYIAGRCFYDVSLDPIAQLRDYANHYYGPAGRFIAPYEEEWARNVDLAYHVKDGTSDAERAQLADQRKKYVDPAVQAVAGDAVLGYRVSKLEKLHTLAEKLAEIHRQHSEIRESRKAGRFDDASRELEAARQYVDELLAHFKSLAELDQGLMDRNEVPGFITLGLKHWLDEEAKAIADKKSEPRP